WCVEQYTTVTRPRKGQLFTTFNDCYPIIQFGAAILPRLDKKPLPTAHKRMTIAGKISVKYAQFDNGVPIFVMLINLQTIYKPLTLPEAAEHLMRPGVYPLYGSGASIIRPNSRDIIEAVDLSGVLDSEVTIDKSAYIAISAGALLPTVIAAVRKLSPDVAAIIEAEAPESTRNVLTVGDVLLECNPNSLSLAVLYGLEAEIAVFAGNSSYTVDVETWFNRTPDQRRSLLIDEIECPWFPKSNFAVAFEKVSRTPADAPIVAAIGFVTPDSDPFAIVVGVADRPVHYRVGLQSSVNDYKGSAEYRTQMAKVLSERAISRATQVAQA
ncbi:MAG: FAD binding domain-containing protein, partial [Chloroflexota bacterium]